MSNTRTFAARAIAAAVITLASSAAHATLVASSQAMGGSTVVSTGNGAAAAGGRTSSYSGFNTAAFSNLYWGFNTLYLPSAGLDYTLHALSFSDATGTTATWTGNTNWTNKDTGYTSNVALKFVIDVTGLGATPWLLASQVAGLDASTGAVVNASSGQNFIANLQILANVGNGFQALNAVRVHTGATKSSFGMTFYSEAPAERVPEPGTIALAGIGLAALAASRKRKAAKQA